MLVIGTAVYMYALTTVCCVCMAWVRVARADWTAARGAEAQLVVAAPVLAGGWALLGEVGKYVRVSRDRFDDVSFSASGIRLRRSGSEREPRASAAGRLLVRRRAVGR